MSSQWLVEFIGLSVLSEPYICVAFFSFHLLRLSQVGISSSLSSHTPSTSILNPSKNEWIHSHISVNRQSVGRSVGRSVGKSAKLSSCRVPPRYLKQISVYERILNTTVRGGMSSPTTVRVCPLLQPPPFGCAHLLFIKYSGLRQVFSLFQSEIYIQCDMALLLSVSSIFPFP